MEKLSHLKREMVGYQDAKHAGKDSQFDFKPIRKLYADIVRLSSRVKVTIGTLSDLEKALNRPFVFSGVRYDEDHMFNQMKRLRLKVIKAIPRLADTNEMKMFYTIEGNISDIRRLKISDYEYASGDEAGLSSDSEDPSDNEDFNSRSQLNDGQTLNTKSDFGRNHSVDRMKRTI